jgi:hypothetical protein
VVWESITAKRFDDLQLPGMEHKRNFGFVLMDLLGKMTCKGTPKSNYVENPIEEIRV